MDLASDAIWATGYFTGSAAFDGASLFGAGADIFVAKLSASGEVISAQDFGGSLTQFGRAVCVDSSGVPIVTGAYADTIDFGQGLFSSAGGNDLFIARID